MTTDIHPQNQVPPCQLCDRKDLQQFVVPDRVTMWYCPKCKLYQYGKVADSTAYTTEYHRGYDHRRRQKLRTARVRLNRIAATLKTDRPRLLDVGSSVGCTVEAAQERGWQAVGVDISDDAVADCQRRGLDCRVVDSVKLPFEDESFDVLTSWHVIEHVADVTETLQEWRRVLRPGGVMVLETPDATCMKVRLQGARYRKFWAPEHSYTFSPKSLARFAERCDFELLRRPLVGRLTDLTPSMASYAVAYQTYNSLRYACGISKAFQIFARRSEKPSSQKPIPKAA